MWYEILPAWGIIFSCMTIGLGAGHYICKWGHEKPFMKALKSNSQCNLYLRDTRIMGDPYLRSGLESIADEPETK